MFDRPRRCLGYNVHEYLTRDCTRDLINNVSRGWKLNFYSHTLYFQRENRKTLSTSVRFRWGSCYRVRHKFMLRYKEQTWLFVFVFRFLHQIIIPRFALLQKSSRNPVTVSRLQSQSQVSRLQALPMFFLFLLPLFYFLYFCPKERFLIKLFECPPRCSAHHQYK